MEKLIIYRDEWLHGESNANSYLLRSADDKKCCLGFECIREGIPEYQLLDFEMPRKGFLAKNSPLLKHEHIMETLAFINDIPLKHNQKIVRDINTNSRYVLPEVTNLLITIGAITEKDDYVYLESEVQREDTITKLFAVIGIEVVFK